MGVVGTASEQPQGWWRLPAPSLLVHGGMPDIAYVHRVTFSVRREDAKQLKTLVSGLSWRSVFQWLSIGVSVRDEPDTAAGRALGMDSG